MRKEGKRKALAALVCGSMLTVALVGGTLAYLQDDASDVNVMTLGNVSIDQLEYERVVENGAWVSTGETDKYGYTPDKLKEFTQAKPLYPAVFADGAIKWDDRNGSQNASGEGSHQQSWGQIGAPGSYQLFDDSVKNAQDKFVFVENTGKSDAYVRTLIAFEQGSVSGDEFENVISTNGNAKHWKWETIATDVVIKDDKGVASTYVVACATYLGPTSNPTGILASGEVSYPSLLQVYMKPEATNEDVEAIDGNGNGKYDILVLSQAVQAEGFDGAAAALNEAFGGVTEANIQTWFGGVFTPKVENLAELREALATGGEFVLANDIKVESTDLLYGADGGHGDGSAFLIKADTVIDLNGHNITVDAPSYASDVFFVKGGHVLTVKGNGTVTADCGIFVSYSAADTINIEGGNYKCTAGNDMLYAIWGKLNVSGGTYESAYWNLINIYGQGNISLVDVSGGSFKNWSPASSPDGNLLADGYKVVSEVVDGVTWYNVVPA